jgi:hypothetical protein
LRYSFCRCESVRRSYFRPNCGGLSALQSALEQLYNLTLSQVRDPARVVRKQSPRLTLGFPLGLPLGFPGTVSKQRGGFDPRPCAGLTKT